MPIDRGGLEAFAVEMRTSRLESLPTELDVMDQRSPRPEERRDALIAMQVRDLPAAVSAPGPLDALLTCETSERHGRIPYAARLSERQPNRPPPPLEREFRRKPFASVIDRFAGKEG